jgi:hypothetical protein
LLLADGLGATDLDFSNGLISQLANAGAQGQKVNVQALNFMLSAETQLRGFQNKYNCASMACEPSDVTGANFRAPLPLHVIMTGRDG